MNCTTGPIYLPRTCIIYYIRRFGARDRPRHVRCVRYTMRRRTVTNGDRESQRDRRNHRQKSSGKLVTASGSEETSVNRIRISTRSRFILFFSKTLQ